MIRMDLSRRQWRLTGVGSDMACMMGCRFIVSKRSEDLIPVAAHSGAHRVASLSIKVVQMTSCAPRVHNT
jgi:hypothetical protein